MLFSYSESSISADDLLKVRRYIRYLYTVENPHEAADIFLDLIQSPGRLDELLSEHSENLKEELDIILQNPSEEFYNRLFTLLWDHASNVYYCELISILSDDQSLKKNIIYVDIALSKIMYKVIGTLGYVITDFIDATQLREAIPHDIQSLTHLHSTKRELLFQNILEVAATRGHIRSNKTRICTDTSVKWLFNLNCMRQLGFIKFDTQIENRPTSGTEIRLLKLFESDDTDFINIVLLANKKFSATLRPLYLALANLNYYNSEPISYALTLALKNSHFYGHLENYYLNSSEAFKQSPKVKSALQLRYIFGYTSKTLTLDDEEITNIETLHNNHNRLKTNKQTNKERGIRNDDYGTNYNLDYYEAIFSHNLINYHLNDLFAIGLALSQLNFSGSRIPEPYEENLYRSARGLHQRIKQLPMEIRTPLLQDSRFALYSLALLTLKYERIANPTHTQSNLMTELKSNARLFKKTLISISTLGAPTGKNLEIPFLRYLIKHLAEFGECSTKNTKEPDAPFIWNAYKECLLSTNESYSLEKMNAVNEWLKKIFHGAETSQTLTSLPEQLFIAIFSASEKVVCDTTPHQLETENNEETFVNATEFEEIDSEDDELSSPVLEENVKALARNSSAQFQAQEYRTAFSQHLERSGSTRQSRRYSLNMR